MIYTFEDVKGSQFKPGTRLWGCGFAVIATDLDDMDEYINQSPIYGELCLSLDEDWEQEMRDEGRTRIAYFTPIEEDELNWENPIPARRYVFADTEEECVEIYNKMVQEKIDLLKSYLVSEEG